jgi:hypothetical protein
MEKLQMRAPRLQILTLFICLALSALSNSAQADSKPNVDKAGVILQGYDAVSYFKGAKPQKGLPTLAATYDGATYLFASESDKVEFVKDPKKYAPQYGGWCAFAVADSKSKVEIDPESFVIQDGRLFVFYDALWAHTRSKWQKDPKAFLKTADANWPEVENKKP